MKELREVGGVRSDALLWLYETVRVYCHILERVLVYLIRHLASTEYWYKLGMAEARKRNKLHAASYPKYALCHAISKEISSTAMGGRLGRTYAPLSSPRRHLDLQTLCKIMIVGRHCGERSVCSTLAMGLCLPYLYAAGANMLA